MLGVSGFGKQSKICMGFQRTFSKKENNVWGVQLLEGVGTAQVAYKTVCATGAFVKEGVPIYRDTGMLGLGLGLGFGLGFKNSCMFRWDTNFL